MLPQPFQPAHHSLQRRCRDFGVIVQVGKRLQTGTVRIIQTNAAGDNVHIIDPATHKVVDMILGIPMAHGVTSAPDGSALYFSNEVDRTLDIVPTKTLRVTKQIPLTGRPNNVAITPDGSKVYVAITREDAFVDVVHLDEERKAAMVSNLLVVLCADRNPQPIVNAGSLY